MGKLNNISVLPFEKAVDRQVKQTRVNTGKCINKGTINSSTTTTSSTSTRKPHKKFQLSGQIWLLLNKV